MRILTPDPESGYGLFPKSNRDFLVQGYICDEIFRETDHSLRRYKPNCGKMPYLAMLKNPSKNSWMPGLPKFNHFFLVHRYICGKIFVKSRSAVFT